MPAADQPPTLTSTLILVVPESVVAMDKAIEAVKLWKRSIPLPKGGAA